MSSSSATGAGVAAEGVPAPRRDAGARVDAGFAAALEEADFPDAAALDAGALAFDAGAALDEGAALEAGFAARDAGLGGIFDELTE